MDHFPSGAPTQVPEPPIPEPILDVPASTLASPWRRLAASTIDAAAILVVAAMALSSYQSGSILYLLVLGGTQIALLMRRAQTVGKVLLRIRFVDASTGNHPGFVRLVPSGEYPGRPELMAAARQTRNS